MLGVISVSGVEVNSLIVAILSLIPTTILAIKVEKHFTQFWTAAWNLFAVFVAGLSEESKTLNVLKSVRMDMLTFFVFQP